MSLFMLIIVMVFDDAVDRLRQLSRRAAPVIVSVEGRPGLSPVGLALEATQGARRLAFEPPGLTDEGNLLALAERLRPFLTVSAQRRPRVRPRSWTRPGTTPVQPGARGGVSFPPEDWPSLLAALPDAAPLTLIVHEPERLAEPNRRFWQVLGRAWLAVRRRGRRVHLLLVGSERGLGRRLNAADAAFRDLGVELAGRSGPDPVEVVRVGAGSHYDLARAAPHWRGRDLLTAWALFGGLPSTWGAAASAARKLPGGNGWSGPPRRRATRTPGSPSAVDADASPSETMRACLAHGRAPLASAPRDELERRTQKTRRYAALLCAVAEGAASWRALADVLGAEGGPGGAGPYLQRLRRLGVVAAERPLDAPSSGRRTRYRLSDPFEAFWWSAVHPVRSELISPDRAERAWTNQIEPRLPGALESAMPQICRNFLRFGSAPLLGAVARRAGPLWGKGFDFPAAATLANGAVCYVHVHSGPGPAGPPALAALDAQARRVRYGRDRQTRFRVLVSLAGFTESLRRESASRPDVRLADADVLAALPKPAPPSLAPPPL